MKSFSRYPTSTLLLTVGLIQLAYTQSQNCSDSNVTSTSSCISHNHQYNFTYPPNNYPEDIEASYKDTINVSWTSFEPTHDPILSMSCDSDKDTSVQSGNSTSTCTLNFTTNATNCYWPFFLGPFKGYDTCHFSLLDLEEGTADSTETTFSSDLHILSNNTDRDGQIWSLENPAPVVSWLSIMEGPMTSGVGHSRIVGFPIWTIWAGVMGGAFVVL